VIVVCIKLYLYCIHPAFVAHPATFPQPFTEILLIDDNSLSGNTDDMCVHEITYFVADCGGSRNVGGIDKEIECSCCTLCCLDENVTCNDSEWLGNHEGMWETGYNRLRWEFEDGMISPYVNYN